MSALTQRNVTLIGKTSAVRLGGASTRERKRERDRGREREGERGSPTNALP